MVRIFLLIGLILSLVIANAPVTHAPEVAFIPETETPLKEATTTPEVPETPSEVPKAAPIPVKEKPIVSEPEPETPALPKRPDPYPFPPKSFATLNAEARSTLVNILCSKESGGMVDPISGSGVIVDPRGVILTNAHVAQFILLASREEINLSCVVRTGSPARGTWTTDILYMPEAWIDQHAQDIQKTRPLGTGEHDYTFLVITGSKDGSPIPAAFPYSIPETRLVDGTGDIVFLAAYPAEFSGGNEVQNILEASTTVTTIKQLMTFGKSTVDVFAIGGVVLAQSGSSGGSALNVWGRLIGLISTTSDGDTTAERNLRAISMPYINRALTSSNGTSIEELLAGDVRAKAAAFMKDKAPKLAGTLIEYIR